MSFEHNWRRKQEMAGRPIADKLYHSIFGDGLKVERMERTDQAILDIQFAIDVKLILPTGQILLGQEKFLSHEYASYESVTVEYFQNPLTKECGDWFKLAVQFYFVGYFTKDQRKFKPWILLNWPNVVLATHQGRIDWKDNGNTKSRARASFRYCTMSRFPEDCVITHSTMDIWQPATTTQTPLFEPQTQTDWPAWLPQEPPPGV